MGKPYTKKEIVEHADANGYLTGYIRIPFLDILTCDPGEFPDLLATQLAGNEAVLSDLSYDVIGIDTRTADNPEILFRVRADASDILDEAVGCTEGSM